MWTSVFAVLILIHGAIHLFGFIRVLQPADWNHLEGSSWLHLHRNVDKLLGLVWGLSFLLFVKAAILTFLQLPESVPVTILAIAMSQLLILVYWKDARFGTAVNVTLIAFLLSL